MFCIEYILCIVTVDDCGDGTDEEDCLGEELSFSKPCGHKNEPTEDEMRIVGGKASEPSKWTIMVTSLNEDQKNAFIVKPRGHGWCRCEWLRKNLTATHVEAQSLSK